jgi:hypothetical protein
MSILADGGSAGMIGTITIISDMTMSITGPTVMRDSNRAVSEAAIRCNTRAMVGAGIPERNAQGKV